MKRIKIYVAAPIFKEEFKRNEQYEIVNYLRSLGYTVYYPIEHKIKNGESLDNKKWGKKVFDADVRNIRNSDFIVLLSYGRLSSAGHNWEAGFAFGIGKKVIVVEMNKEIMSLMVANGCYARITKNELYDYNFKKIKTTNTEQK